MSLRWQAICVDCADPASLGRWWAELLGWRLTYREADEVVLEPPRDRLRSALSPDLLFLKVPEPKTVKDRLRIELRPQEQAAEVAHAEALGTRRSRSASPTTRTPARWCSPIPRATSSASSTAFTPEELRPRRARPERSDHGDGVVDSRRVGVDHEVTVADSQHVLGYASMTRHIAATSSVKCAPSSRPRTRRAQHRRRRRAGTTTAPSARARR